MEYLSNSLNDTKKFAKLIAKDLKGGDCLGLVGNLGAGKTTFSQALGKALGIKQTMTSPTFVLMKIYPVKHPTIKQLCHIDAYRLKSKEDLIAIGANDYISNPEIITIIEWADKVRKLLPKNTKIFNVKILDNSRIINYK